jgi:hypothetical protein
MTIISQLGRTESLYYKKLSFWHVYESSREILYIKMVPKTSFQLLYTV